MTTRINPDGSTNGISGKVKASTAGGTTAALVASSLVYELDRHVAWAHSIFSDLPWSPGMLIALVAGIATYATGYLATHAPGGLVNAVRDAWSTSVNDANAIPPSAGAEEK